MISLNINLYRDWINNRYSYIEGLKEQKFLFKSFEEWKDERTNENNTYDKSFSQYKFHTIISYLNHQYRIISPKKRTIIKPKNFVCPVGYTEGLRSLENKIIKGENLFKHFSRKIFNAEMKDGLLFDWGIHHLHLGLNPDEKHPSLLEGTEKVLYVIVRDEIMYFLKIGDHNEFANKELLIIAKNNFPELLKGFESSIIEAEKDFSDEERIKLRKAGVNVMTTNIEGVNYFSPGGGIVSSGDSLYVMRKHQEITYFFERAEKFTRNILSNFEHNLRLNNLKTANYYDIAMVSIDGSKMYLEDRINHIIIAIRYDNRNNFNDYEIGYMKIESSRS